MVRSEKYLCYRLGHELFASPLEKVVEIYQLQELTPMKRGKSVFLGNFEVGGLEMPLVDLPRIAGISRSRQLDKEESCIIVFDLSDGPWGALVDGIEGIINFSSSDIQRTSGLDSPIYGKTSGVNHTYLLINPEMMVNKIERIRWGITKGYQQAS